MRSRDSRSRKVKSAPIVGRGCAGFGDGLHADADAMRPPGDDAFRQFEIGIFHRLQLCRLEKRKRATQRMIGRENINRRRPKN